MEHQSTFPAQKYKTSNRLKKNKKRFEVSEFQTSSIIVKVNTLILNKIIIHCNVIFTTYTDQTGKNLIKITYDNKEIAGN